MERSVKFGIGVVFILATAACVRESLTEPAVDGLITLNQVDARVSEFPMTKAHLEKGSQIVWDLSDRIGVFSDRDDAIPFKKTTSGNTFESSEALRGTEFYAFFPYAESTFNPENRQMLNFTLDNGTAAGGENPVLTVPMLAKSKNMALEFKQTSGVLHFSIKGSFLLSSVTLRGNTGEKVGGTFSVDLNGSLPVLNPVNGVDLMEVQYIPESPVQLSTEKGYDVYFILPPMTFVNGLTIILTCDDGTELTKSTTRAVTVSRAIIKNFEVFDADELVENQEDALTLERNALIDFYNAMNGPDWVDNKNWCSDKPMGEWSGVYTDSNTGHVTFISLMDNNMMGSLPESIVNLKELSALSLWASGPVENWDRLYELRGLYNLSYGIGDTFNSDVETYRSWCVTIPPAIANMKNLVYLSVFGVTGPLPEELFSLEQLQSLRLQWYLTDTSLPSGFGKLKNLESLIIQGAHDLVFGKSLTGPIPEDLYDCTSLKTLYITDTGISGTLSPRIGNLKNLGEGNLYLCNNELSGPLPAELSNIHFSRTGGYPLDLRINHFSGAIPAEFRQWEDWNYLWGYIVENNELDYSSCTPLVPDFEVKTLTGETFSTQSIKGNSLTVFFQWATWCPFSPGVVTKLKALYSDYKDKGFEVVSWSNEDEATIRSYVEQHDIPWTCFSNNFELATSGGGLGLDYWPTNDFPGTVLFDGDGQMVSYYLGDSDDLVSFIRNWFGDGPDPTYESTDFSADGTVHVLQRATLGNGIDVVMMGDAFSDRMIADGTYAARMETMADALFSEEPYKSFRDCFNVYYVDVVSKNEIYSGDTTLGTWYGDGTDVGGENDKVCEYVRLALPEERMDDALVMVAMNRDYYAGTCYMMIMPDGDYGRGLSIAYFPTSSNPETFRSIVAHEAGGHGFAKLLDEYVTEGHGALPEDEKTNLLAFAPYGYGSNVDVTAEPETVKWHQFLSDVRYANEGLGCYEGAMTYLTGVWRPSENSIMRYNSSGFNAPSRYAIWHRIHKLAFGPDWEGTYEDFVAYDALNRKPSATPAKMRQNYVEKKLPPLAPPVVVSSSWLDVL